MRNSLNNLIYNILTYDVKAREDDMYLLARVVEAESGVRADKEYIIKMLEHWRYLNLPNFNTVIRSRRKIQVEHPELISNHTAIQRKHAEFEFRQEYRKKRG